MIGRGSFRRRHGIDRSVLLTWLIASTSEDEQEGLHSIAFMACIASIWATPEIQS